MIFSKLINFHLSSLKFDFLGHFQTLTFTGACVSYGNTLNDWTFLDKTAQNQPSVLFKYFSKKKDWNKARDECRKLFKPPFPEAQLAAIMDSAENTIIENLRPDEKTWVGGYCNKSQKKWYWLEGPNRGDFDYCFDGSGCSDGFEDWGDDYDNCSEDKLELPDDRSKRWNDKNKGNDYPYICQIRLG